MMVLSLPVACGHVETIPEVPCPERPELIGTDLEASDEVKAIVVENYLRLIEYAEKLETRAECR